MIKVNSWGYVHFDKWQICLSQTMIDQCIEFRRNPDWESFSACFRNFRSAELKIENGELYSPKNHKAVNCVPCLYTAVYHVALDNIHVLSPLP